MPLACDSDGAISNDHMHFGSRTSIVVYDDRLKTRRGKIDILPHDNET